MEGIFSINNPVWRCIDKLLGIFFLHILWLICSIPIITIGASTTAVYYVTLKMVHNQEGYIARSFFKAFKDNFKSATVIWLILLAVGGFIGVDLAVYMRSSSLSLVEMALLVMFFAAMVLFLLTGIYVFPLTARFENTVKATLFNAVIMAVKHLPLSILMFSGDAALLTVGFLFFPPVLMLGFPLLAYYNSWFLIKIFDRYGTEIRQGS